MAGTTRFLRSCSIIQRILDVVLKRSRIFLETKRLTVSRFNEKDPFSARKLELCPLETKRRDHSTSLSTDTVLCQQFRPWKPINRQTERERERERDNYHGKASNRVQPKINRKNTSTATELHHPASKQGSPMPHPHSLRRRRLPVCSTLPIEPPSASFHPTLHAGGERRSKEPW